MQNSPSSIVLETKEHLELLSEFFGQDVTGIINEWLGVKPLATKQREKFFLDELFGAKALQLRSSQKKILIQNGIVDVLADIIVAYSDNTQEEKADHIREIQKDYLKHRQRYPESIRFFVPLLPKPMRIQQEDKCSLKLF